VKINLASTVATLIAILSCVGAFAGTPNTTAAGAVSYEVGQGWVSDNVAETAQNRWFAFKENPGRSYCVDAAMGSGTYFPLDPNLTIYTDTTGVTPYLSNTDSALEPPRNKGATICYASPLTAAGAVRAFKLNVPVVSGSGDSGLVRTQVIETTLFGEWFSFTTGPASSAPLIKTTLFLYNHTKSAINATLYLPPFTRLGPYSVPGEGGMNQTPILSTALNFGYSNPAFVMHDGYAGALSGWFDIYYPPVGSAPAFTVRYVLMQR